MAGPTDPGEEWIDPRDMSEEDSIRAMKSAIDVLAAIYIDVPARSRAEYIRNMGRLIRSRARTMDQI